MGREDLTRGSHDGDIISLVFIILMLKWKSEQRRRKRPWQGAPLGAGANANVSGSAATTTSTELPTGDVMESKVVQDSAPSAAGDSSSAAAAPAPADSWCDGTQLPVVGLRTLTPVSARRCERMLYRLAAVAADLIAREQAAARSRAWCRAQAAAREERNHPSPLDEAEEERDEAGAEGLSRIASLVPSLHALARRLKRTRRKLKHRLRRYRQMEDGFAAGDVSSDSDWGEGEGDVMERVVARSMDRDLIAAEEEVRRAEALVGDAGTEGGGGDEAEGDGEVSSSSSSSSSSPSTAVTLSQTALQRAKRRLQRARLRVAVSDWDGARYGDVGEVRADVRGLLTAMVERAVVGVEAGVGGGELNPMDGNENKGEEGKGRETEGEGEGEGEKEAALSPALRILNVVSVAFERMLAAWVLARDDMDESPVSGERSLDCLPGI